MGINFLNIYLLTEKNESFSVEAFLGLFIGVLLAFLFLAGLHKFLLLWIKKHPVNAIVDLAKRSDTDASSLLECSRPFSTNKRLMKRSLPRNLSVVAIAISLSFSVVCLFFHRLFEIFPLVLLFLFIPPYIIYIRQRAIYLIEESIPEVKQELITYFDEAQRL